jgi:hypothetical protein
MTAGNDDAVAPTAKANGSPHPRCDATVISGGVNPEES